MKHSSVALYNHRGKRLLTLKEAEKKGYGATITLKQRIRRKQIKGYKVGPLWLVLESMLRHFKPRIPRSHNGKTHHRH